MQLNLWDVLSNLIGLFLLIGVGFCAVRAGILPATSSSLFSRLLMKISLPCTVFTSLLRPYDPGFLRDLLTALLLGFLIFPMNALLSRPLSRLFRAEHSRRGMWRFCATFCNNGFMGFPIVLALFGEEGLALAAIHGMAFNTLVYTMGEAMVRSDCAAQSGKLNLPAILFTPVNLATLLGLILYFTRLAPPAALLTPITHVANLTTPLSMLVIGINLYGQNAMDLFRDRDTCTVSLTRLLLMPLAAFSLLTVCDRLFALSDPLIFGVVFLSSTMPSPGLSTIFAETYGVNQKFSAGVVFVSSLFCLVTIPLMSLLI